METLQKRIAKVKDQYQTAKGIGRPRPLQMIAHNLQGPQF